MTNYNKKIRCIFVAVPRYLLGKTVECVSSRLRDCVQNAEAYVEIGPMFPLSWAGGRLRSNWNAPARIELLRRSWNISSFIANILIMHITKTF
jgi:hypothetical protein